MSRKKRKPQLRCFVFTLGTIKLTQEAMKLFAQLLARTEDQSAKAAFAKEMMQQVNGKLDAMGSSVGVMCLTTFDYNEKIVIATAIQLYTLDLLSAPSTSQRQRELQQCRQIAAYFALDHLQIEPLRTTQDLKRVDQQNAPGRQ